MLPTQDKVVLISRRLAKPSLDFRLLDKSIKSKYPHVKVVILCHQINNPAVYLYQLVQEMYHLATAKACVAESYVIPVSILKHKPSLVVVQMWHALGAIKQFGYQSLDKPEGSSSRVARLMQMHQGYDHVLCGSEAMSPVFAEAFNVDIQKVEPIGLPRVDYILNGDKRKRNFEMIKNHYPEIGERKVILYVPTFRKDSIVKMDKLINKINERSDEYCLIVKQHIHDKTDIDWGGSIHDKKFDTDTLLAVADYVVTDYSAAVFEAAVADVPVYLYAYDLEEYSQTRGLNVDYESEMPGPVCRTIDELIEAIDSDQYNMDRLRQFASKYVNVRDGSSTDRIIKLLGI